MDAAVEPTSDQRRLLGLIYDEFQRTGRRPTYQWIDKLVDAQGVSLRRLVTTMPPGLMTPESAWGGGYYWRKEDELLVTVKGLLYCGDGAMRDLDLLAHVLRYFADRERDFRPELSHQAEDLVITSEAVRHDLDLTNAETQKVFVLLEQFENRLRFGSGRGDSEWTWTLECEQIRRYRNVMDARTYLDARGDLPAPAPTSRLGRAQRRARWWWVEVVAFARRIRQRTPDALRSFIRHPLVIGITVAVVSTLLTLYLR